MIKVLLIMIIILIDNNNEDNNNIDHDAWITVIFGVTISVIHPILAPSV